MFDSTILQSRNLRLLPNAITRSLAETLFCLIVMAFCGEVALGDPPGSEAENAAAPASGLAVDRKTTLTVLSFRHHVAKSDFAAAVEEFQRLQTSDALLMVPVGDSGRTFAPLYRVLFDSFFEFPAPYRRRIVQALEISANRRLMGIVTESDYREIPSLIRQYAGTEASLQAHILMARQHLDRGNTLGVKSWLAPLTRKNVDESYRQAATDILEGLAGDGSTGRSGTDDDHSRSQRDAIPEQVVWQFRAGVSQKVQKHIEMFGNIAVAAKAMPHTTWRGLTDDGVNFRRTLQGVIAVDLESGEPLWQFPLQPQLETSLTKSRTDSSVFSQSGSVNSVADDLFSAMERTALANLFCRDNVTGQVMGDSERLYLVANLGTPAIAGTSSPVGFSSRSISNGFRGSQLIALEKSSGRRVWSSGERAFEEAGETSSTVWFAGVAAVVHNRLYSVVERDGEIRLACLAKRTGELLWSTPLAWPDQSIDKDPFRQMRSATPTVQQGVVWCSTTTGWVTCVDEITRAVLWASDVRGTAIVEPSPMPRGRPVVMTPWTSIRDHWTIPKLTLAGDSLVVLPHESHEICLLDPSTGDFRQRLPMQPASMLLHLDKTAIVCCEESALVCRSTGDGTVKWSTDLGSAGLPTGQPTSESGSLLIPMTTGALLRVELSSGEISEQSASVLPAHAWGDLTRADAEGDLLYSTPDRLIRLSSKRSRSQPGKPIEIAAALLKANRCAEALRLANGVLNREPGNAEAKEICFRCRVSLAGKQPDDHLPQLKQMKKTPQQQLQVFALEIEALLGQQKNEAAALRLAQILTLDTALLPLSAAALSGPPDAGEAVIEMSFHTWATLKLSELLKQIPAPESIITQLEGVSVPVLLSLHHPALLPAIYVRCENSPSPEESLQLLHHAVKVKSQSMADSPGGSGVDFRREAELLKRLAEKLSEVSTRQSLVTLLNIVALESPPEFLAAVQSLGVFGEHGFRSEDGLRDQFRAEQKRCFGQWSVGSYQTIPVARLRSSGRVEKLLTYAEPDDLFLSRFRWTATAGDYGRLQAEDVVDTNVPQWSIPGNFQLHGTYSFQRDVLMRAGSVLLVKSYASMTAVSALDQRVLWSRSFPYVATTIPASMDRNFDRPDGHGGCLPTQKLPSSFQVVGAGHGWLALTNGAEFSLIELYSGRTKWSMTLPAKTSRVVAAEARVWVASEDRGVTSYHSEDGQPVLVPSSIDESMTLIRAVENVFVCWKQSANRQDPRLQWIDSSTNAIVDDVDLKEMQQFCLVDDSTLVGFNGRHQFQVVNLRSRVSNTLTFKPAASESAGLEAVNVPMWDPARMQLASDGLNYYLCYRNEKTGESVRSPANRNLMIFTGDLIALDRQSGEQQWTVSNSEVLMSTVDQPELPILVLVSASKPLAAGQAIGSSTFQGISKLSGRTLFQQSLPMQSSLRVLSIDSPAVNSLNVGIQGLQVRIEALANSDAK